MVSGSLGEKKWCHVGDIARVNVPVFGQLVRLSDKSV